MSGAAAVSPGAWRLAGGRLLRLDAPAVAGILNLTPDSFSDGGDLPTVTAALARAHALVEAGATLLDVGGESTRPGAREVPADEELARVLPFIHEAARTVGVPLAIDTRKARVAAAALEAGASIVNDVSGLAHDPDLGRVVADAGAGLVLMHMRGTPADMAGRARYADVVAEVAHELEHAVDRARAAGVDDDRIVVDPGLGFAKTAEQSLELLGRLDELAGSGFPLYVGPSRKSFLGHVLGVPAAERGSGTVAACVLAWQKGAGIFRVHEPGPVVRALAVVRAIEGAGRAAR
jgi:dihydropteroate synthase